MPSIHQTKSNEHAFKGRLEHLELQNRIHRPPAAVKTLPLKHLLCRHSRMYVSFVNLSPPPHTPLFHMKPCSYFFPELIQTAFLKSLTLVTSKQLSPGRRFGLLSSITVFETEKSSQLKGNVYTLTPGIRRRRAEGRMSNYTMEIPEFTMFAYSEWVVQDQVQDEMLGLYHVSVQYSCLTLILVHRVVTALDHIHAVI